MKWTGKFVGSLIGLMLGNPLSIILGFLAGHLYDIGWFTKWINQGASSQNSRIQNLFFNCSFMIMGHLAKCDGRVSENEIRIATKIMDEMKLSQAMKREAMRLFNEGKQPNFNLDKVIMQLRLVCWSRPSLLKIFIEIQVQMAYADGAAISQTKRSTLEHICRKLGLAGFRFSQFEQRQRAGQSYQHYQYRHHYQSTNSRAHLSDAYRILGVNSSANDAEVKKAYRRLMSQNHPDKLIAKGVPPEMIKIATQKTQQIKEAYEQICAARKGGK